MGKSKRTKACDISANVSKEVRKRDEGCIFCQMGYRMPPEDEFITAMGQLQIMHFVPRSQGGLGIPQNLACGCAWHHMLLDNGKDTRADMLSKFEEYLNARYKGWNREMVVFNKWRFLKKEGNDVH